MNQPRPPTRQPTTRPTIPTALDAEKALLGAILTEPQVLRRQLAAFDSAWCFEPRHRRIIDLLRRLQAEGTQADLVTLPEHLRQDPALVGEVSYVLGLPDQTPSTANLDHYAEEVRRAFVRRVALAEAERIAHASGQPLPLDELRELVIASTRKVLGAGESMGESATAEAVTSRVLDVALSASKASESGSLRDRVTLPTGYDALDEALGGGFGRGALVTLAARPGMGKTALMLELCRQAIAPHGFAEGDEHALVMSLEMSAEELGQRMLSRETGLPHQAIRTGNLDDKGWQTLSAAVEDVKGWPIAIVDRRRLSMDAIIGSIFTEASRRKLRMVCLDYLQIVRVANVERRDLALSDAIADYKAACAEVGAVAILLSQFGRSIAKNGGTPCLEALKETGGIEEHSDIVIGLDRPGLRGEPLPPWELHLHVLKSRTSGPAVLQGSFIGATMKMSISRIMEPGELTRQSRQAYNAA